MTYLSQDVRTDAKIQEMIREVFDGCTVFAIAHRLGPIIDYDRICVLEQGKQVEFGACALAIVATATSACHILYIVNVLSALNTCQHPRRCSEGPACTRPRRSFLEAD